MGCLSLAATLPPKEVMNESWCRENVHNARSNIFREKFLCKSAVLLQIMPKYIVVEVFKLIGIFWHFLKKTKPGNLLSLGICLN